MTRRAHQKVVRVDAHTEGAAQRHRWLLSQCVIEAGENCRRSDLGLAYESGSMSHEAGHRRRAHALSSHIPDDDDPAVRSREEVIEVATDLYFGGTGWSV